MAIIYGIYLVNYNNIIRIPVNPIDEYTIDGSTDHGSYNVLSIGEIVAPRLPLPLEVEWESFFPVDGSAPYVSTSSDFKVPDYYINLFRGFMNNRLPIQLIIDRRNEDGTISGESTNMKAIITQFNVTEKGGETGDYYYTIRLKEYRDYEPSLLTFYENTDNDGNTTYYANVDKQRESNSSILSVGDNVFVNGDFYSDPTGSSIAGTISNRVLSIGMIIKNPIPSEIYTIYIAGYGWVGTDQVRVNGVYDYS